MLCYDSFLGFVGMNEAAELVAQMASLDLIKIAPREGAVFDSFWGLWPHNPPSPWPKKKKKEWMNENKKKEVDRKKSWVKRN